MDAKRDAHDIPLLDRRLIPHRSLDAKSFRTFMIATFVATAAFSIPFYLMGAWPIVGFLGLDVLGLYVAFKMNFRAAQAHEHFRLTYLELNYARVSASGQRREWRFTPAWVRLERIDDEEYGPQRLSLHSGGRRWDIGRHVGPDGKAEFARSLSHALAEARRGPRFSE